MSNTMSYSFAQSGSSHTVAYGGQSMSVYGSNQATVMLGYTGGSQDASTYVDPAPTTALKGITPQEANFVAFLAEDCPDTPVADDSFGQALREALHKADLESPSSDAEGYDDEQMHADQDQFLDANHLGDALPDQDMAGLDGYTSPDSLFPQQVPQPAGESENRMFDQVQNEDQPGAVWVDGPPDQFEDSYKDGQAVVTTYRQGPPATYDFDTASRGDISYDNAQSYLGQSSYATDSDTDSYSTDGVEYDDAEAMQDGYGSVYLPMTTAGRAARRAELHAQQCAINQELLALDQLERQDLGME